MSSITNLVQGSFNVSGTISNSTINSWSIMDTPPSLQLQEDTVVKIGNNFIITGKELKACMKFLKEQAIQAYPEEFI